jgi:hypothetical protein
MGTVVDLLPEQERRVAERTPSWNVAPPVPRAPRSAIEPDIDPNQLLARVAGIPVSGLTVLHYPMVNENSSMQCCVQGP